MNDKRVLEFKLNDDTPVYVEVAQGAGYDAERVSRSDDGGTKSFIAAETRFTEAIARVKPAAEFVLNAFREMNEPDQIGLDFGIKFNAKAGAVIASVDSEATFKVSLLWKKAGK